MRAKKHITPDNRLLLAVCDSDILGQVFSEGEHQLDLAIGFYDGGEVDEAALLSLMEKAYIINLAGEKCIAIGIRKGYIKEGNVRKIQSIPFAQAMAIPKE